MNWVEMLTHERECKITRKKVKYFGKYRYKKLHTRQLLVGPKGKTGRDGKLKRTR